MEERTEKVYQLLNGILIPQDYLGFNILIKNIKRIIAVMVISILSAIKVKLYKPAGITIDG